MMTTMRLCDLSEQVVQRRRVSSEARSRRRLTSQAERAQELRCLPQLAVAMPNGHLIYLLVELERAIFHVQVRVVLRHSVSFTNMDVIRIHAATIAFELVELLLEISSFLLLLDKFLRDLTVPGPLRALSFAAKPL